MPGEPGVPRDRGAQPSLDEVLALRADRMATVRHPLGKVLKRELREELRHSRRSSAEKA